MPFKWDVASERDLLLCVIGEMTPPATSIWPAVAEKLGGGLNGSACSQKFYKLKRESEKLLETDGSPGTAPATPSTKPVGKAGGTKRKKNTDVNDDETPASSKVKKAKKLATEPNNDIKGEPKTPEGVDIKVEQDDAGEKDE
ncbi:uncharacterized protein Z518_00008 [Rhinocladiella mackenziei CBS 650.93]|uniref:Myb-like domain-containing protein n=1 Tax=Rhinocladiella mackenziei CBS 650.93 TaxID=1442369 RepID=A0A0D2JHW8_9EURO|nr:uncharacterized protein Z518_00008 [Rhinocladiella mackenziei CBS 650.93]KIX08930.1 hypothetical protein Z518_00008 [Rhinocladiella mackenziei CBS 650.93]